MLTCVLAYSSHGGSATCNRLAGGRRTRVIASAKKKKSSGPNYGSGRAWLPGLADMPGLNGGSTSGSNSNSDSSGGGSQSPAPDSEDGPSLSSYLRFGRLMGESSEEVQKRLEESGAPVRVDEESRQYLQAWEEQELQSYAMFEAVLAAQADGRTAGTSAAAKKLQRNKQVASVATEIQREREQYRAEMERLLAKRKQAPDATQAAAALTAKPGSQQARGSTLQLVSSRPARPQSPSLVAKPSRPVDPEDFVDVSYLFEEGEFDFDSAWEEAEAYEAAEAEGQQAAYGKFAELLGKPATGSSKASKKRERKSSSGSGSTSGAAFSTSARGSLSAVQQLKGSVLERPAAADQASPQQPSIPAGGMVRLHLGQPPARPGRPAAPAVPVALQAKPKASSAARQAAQRAPPAPSPPAPTLAAKPTKPAVTTSLPAATPTPAPKLEAPPPLAAKPAAKPAASAGPSAATQPVVKPAPPPAAAAVPAPSAKPTPPFSPATASRKQEAKPALPAAEPTPEPRPTPAAPTKPTAPGVAAAEAAPATGGDDELPASGPGLAQPEPLPAAAAIVTAPASAAAAAAEQATPRVEGPTRQEPAQPAAKPAKKLQRPAFPPPAGQHRNMEQMQAERRARNAEYGAKCLLDRSNETLTVWQVNAAGVLVRNERLAGFIPLSQLAPSLVSKVLQEEQMLLAAVSSAALVAQQETAQLPAAQATPSQPTTTPEVDSATRGAFRRQALAAVMMGRQVTARAINVDDRSGRVVLSERAAMMGREAVVRKPPTPQQLQAAAAMLGQTVDATVLTVKPFGCFVEFLVPSGASASARSNSQEQPAMAAEGEPVVGLVHRVEITWDPMQDITDAVQEGQRVKAKVVHVDATKARVFLSIRKTKPNPLLETLDSLVASSAAAATMGPGLLASGSAGNGSTSYSSSGSTSAAQDQRQLLGDLPEAVRFCEVLRGSPGVVGAELGPRVQSRAASQELEVYMATKEQASSFGASLAAADGSNSCGNGGGTELLAAAAASSTAHSYNLVLRKEQSVQEVTVLANLSREDMRQLAATAVASMAEEASAMPQ